MPGAVYLGEIAAILMEKAGRETNVKRMSAGNDRIAYDRQPPF